MAIFRGPGGSGDATTDSTTQALAATQAAADALASKNAAAASETSAANSATSATASATSATNSATTATTQAGIATTKAGEASTSATNAATSASTATTQATNASNSATAAAASAASASTNVDNAFSAITSTATTLSPGASATSSFNTSTKVLTLGVPSGAAGATGATGAKGDKGDTGAGVAAGGTTGQVLAKASATDYDTTWVTSAGMVYPSAGIPNSTGSAWGTSYGVTGTGSVVLNSNPSFATDITVNGITAGKGAGNVASNTAYGFDAIGSSFINASNINNVGIGYNALNTIGSGVLTVTKLSDGLGYESGSFTDVTLEYLRGTPIIAGGVYPKISGNVTGGVITISSVTNGGVGWTALDTVFTSGMLDGFGFECQIASLQNANNNTAIGYNAGNTTNSNINSIYIGSGATGVGNNEIIIGANGIGGGSNTTVIGNINTVTTTIRGTTAVAGLTAQGTLNLTGSATVNQNIATSQTLGTLNIGGGIQNSSGDINLGRSLGTQTVNIAAGVTAISCVKTINIGTGATSANVQTNVNVGGTNGIGTLTFGQSTNVQTVNIATGANTNTKTLNLGTGATLGATNIAIGATAGTSTTTLNGAVTLAATTQAIDIGTNQTTGVLTLGGSSSSGQINIGGASATGSIAIGRSTGNQTVSIAVGNTASGSTKTINIGAGGSAGGFCNIVLGGVSTTTLITARGAIQDKVYTVATLPTGAVGMRAFVSDALNTAFNDIAASGGSVGTGSKPVFHDGTYWRIG
jgi:hypothetical protein